MIESNDRPAWTQYENFPYDGAGSGLNSYKNKQPVVGANDFVIKDYYVRTEGEA